MCGVELPELLPGQVRDGQRLSARHHRVGVVWVQFVLEVLGINSLVLRLQKSIKSHKNKIPTDQILYKYQQCSFSTNYLNTLHQTLKQGEIIQL